MTTLLISSLIVGQIGGNAKQNVDELIRIARMPLSVAKKHGGVESVANREGIGFSWTVPKSRIGMVVVTYDRYTEYTEPGVGKYKYDGDEIVGPRAFRIVAKPGGVLVPFQGDWRALARKFGVKLEQYGTRPVSSVLKPGYKKILLVNRKGQGYDDLSLHQANVTVHGTRLKVACNIIVWLDAGQSYPGVARSYIQFLGFNGAGFSAPGEVMEDGK